MDCRGRSLPRGQQLLDVANLGVSSTKSLGVFEPIIKKGTAPVRSLKSSESGVFDLRGNVWEWTGDYFDPVTSPDAVRDPSGPSIRPGAGDSRRVLRLLNLELVS